MKTTVTLPDCLFEEAERFAAQRSMSRSELYARALTHFIESQSVLGVRERLDSVYATHPQESELDAAAAALQSESLVRKW
jgi:metal-responsive CopG/Arc/MetJ family transcriptional regulator